MCKFIFVSASFLHEKSKFIYEDIYYTLKFTVVRNRKILLTSNSEINFLITPEIKTDRQSVNKTTKRIAYHILKYCIYYALEYAVKQNSEILLTSNFND